METAQGCSVRYYEARDDEALVRLLQAVYGRWPAHAAAAEPIEHLRWKLRSHADAMRWHVVAEAGSELVGSRLFWVQQLRVRSRQLVARQGVDIAVHPDYQGRGVLTAMRNFAREESASAFDVELHLGSTRSHPALVRLRAREGEPPLLGNPVAVFGARLERLPDHAPALLELPVAVRETSCFDERIDALAEQACRAFDVAFVRDRAYLNWRYCDAPGRPYRVRLAEDGGLILGYSVLRVSGERAYIADLLALPDRIEVARALVVDAIAQARRAGAERIECWLPSRHVYRSLLEELGMKQRLVRNAMAFGPLRTPLEELAPLLDPNAAVHLMMGDTDLV